MVASKTTRLCKIGGHHWLSAGATIHAADAVARPASGLDCGLGIGIGVGEARPSAWAISCNTSGLKLLKPKPLRCSASGVIFRHAA